MTRRDSRGSECGSITWIFGRWCRTSMKSQLEPSCKPARPVTRRGRKGNAMVEVALLAPWIFFLFIGVLDVGFYCYALMAVGNAARVAALQNSVGLGSANDSAGACLAAARELQSLPNMVGKFT